MNERSLLALGVLLGVGSGTRPERWLDSVHGYIRGQQSADPANSIVMTVLAGAAAFYAVERHENPKINSFFDALVYVSTNLSVGYSDILAKTDAGKAIGSALMTYGPALAARALDPPHEARERREEGERSEAQLRAIADKLELILLELRERRSGPEEHG